MTPTVRPRRGPVNLRTVETLARRQAALIAELAQVSAELAQVLTGAPPVSVRVARLKGVFDAAWCARYHPGFVKRYVWKESRDEPALRKLVGQLEDADLEARVGRYIASDGEYYREARHAFALFVATINDWTAPAPVPGDERDEEDEIQATKARLRRFGVEDYTR